jgi:hypothetical protein
MKRDIPGWTEIEGTGSHTLESYEQCVNGRWYKPICGQYSLEELVMGYEARISVVQNTATAALSEVADLRRQLTDDAKKLRHFEARFQEADDSFLFGVLENEARRKSESVLRGDWTVFDTLFRDIKSLKRDVEQIKDVIYGDTDA